MKRLPAVLTTFLMTCTLAFAQVDIRNPSVDTETEQGSLITQSGTAEDDATRTQLLETVAEKYSDHSAINYVYLQLQGLHLAAGNFDKVITYGKKLLEVVPGDVEIRQNLTKGYEAKQDFDSLLPHLLETKPYAEKDTKLAEPEYEDEVEAWQAQIDYAKGVLQYIEYSMYTSLLKITDPAKKITYMDALKEHYPEGQYAGSLGGMYVQVYQQQGDVEKMLSAMEASLQSNPGNEGYLFTLAESAVRQQQNDKSKTYAEQLVQAMSQKAKPENQTEEDWTKHKDLFMAYGNYILGKLTVLQATNAQGFRDGRKQLLTTVAPIQERARYSIAGGKRGRKRAPSWRPRGCSGSRRSWGMRRHSACSASAT